MGFLGDLFKGFANSWLADALGWWIGLLYEWTSGVVNFLATWWMGLAPLAAGEGSATDRVASSTAFLVPVIGLASTLFAVAKAGRADAESGQEVTEITTGLIRLLFVSAAGVTGTFMLMQFSSALAPWLFDVITIGAGDDRKLISSTMTDSDTDFLASLSGAGYLFALPVMLLAAMTQACMAVGTDVGAAVLSAVLPLTASASVTPKGREAFAKQVGWILSCVAFKPAAAIIYGFGVALINGSNIVPSAAEEGSAGPFVSVLIGTMTLILSALTLPALVKLISPSASILGSGGGRFMAAAGGVAAGAGMAALRMRGGSVSGSSSQQGSGAEGAQISSSASGASSAGGSGSSAGAASGGGSAAAGGAAGAGVMAAQKVAGAAQKVGEGIKQGAAAMGLGASGAQSTDSDSASGSSASDSSTAATGSTSSTDGVSSADYSSAGSSSGASSGSSSSGAASRKTESGSQGSSSGPEGAADTSSPAPQSSASGSQAPVGTTTPVGPRNKITPAPEESKHKNPSGAMSYKIQNAARALAEDTEGAINPEGADH